MDDCKPLPAPVAPRVPIAREDPELTASQPWNIKQETLRNFQCLPRELRDRILSLACTLRPLHVWPGTDFSPVAVDVRTTRSIALVSRSCYKLAIELLYGRVSIRRPSALQELQKTLATRPDLGLLVKSLHLGPTEKLPDSWWPIRSWSIGSIQFTTVLGGHEFDQRRPGWCKPRHEFEVPYTPRQSDYGWYDNRMKGVSDAIESASRALDVDLRRTNRSHSGPTIGADVYTIRVFEVQAACELYLLELRRLHGGVTCGCGSGTLQYPALAIVGLSLDVSSTNVFWITRSQLRAHMAGRASPDDHFDHPLLFARCGLRWVAQDAQGQTHQGGSSTPTSDGVADEVDLFLPSPSQNQGSGQSASTDVTANPHLLLPSTATVGGNLALLRAVLAFTPYVRSLSLTGFLERAVVGSRPAPALRALESLTVGPPPVEWQSPLHLDPSALSRLKRLRVCGAQPSKENLCAILGAQGALPKLKEFQWSFTGTFTLRDGGPPSLFDTVSFLLAYDATAADPQDPSRPAPPKKRRRTSNEEGQSPLQEMNVRRLSVDVRLQANDARRVLAGVIPAARTAWRTGAPFPGCNRVQVFASRCDGLSGFAAQKELYEEGKEWWDGELVGGTNNGRSGGAEEVDQEA